MNAATQPCWKFNHDAIMSSTVSETWPIAVNSLFWARDSFCVACRLWLPCHISKMSWTLTMVCNCVSTTSRFDCQSFSDFIVCSGGLSPVNISLFTSANYLSILVSARVSPVVFDCLQPLMSCQREKLASTPTPCGMGGHMLCPTLEWLVYFKCISSCCHCRLVICSIQNVLLVSMGLEG